MSLFTMLMVTVVMLITMTTVLQQLELATMDCNETENQTITIPQDKPLGKTDSFGGAGSGQFGGYTGEVKESWDYKELSVLKNRETSIFGRKDCTPKSAVSNTTSEVVGALGTFENIMPLFVVVTVLGMVAIIISRVVAFGGIGEGL